MLIEGTYHYKVADKELKSNSGETILVGDTYFAHAKENHILTLNEGEVELLGLKDYSTEKRRSMAKAGTAMADGSYPIADCGDVKDALHRIGSGTKHSKAAIKAHIRKRAKALGCKIPGSEVLN